MQGSDAASETDSDGLGPDGWDDVLSAWMSNAGILAHQQDPEPLVADDAHHRHDPHFYHRSPNCSVYLPANMDGSHTLKF